MTMDRPLAPGEAALLLELRRGAYTAVVTAREGETGEVVLGYVLVE